MPIGEAHKSGSSFTGLCEYVLAQGRYHTHHADKKPEVVSNNFIYGTDYLDIGKQFNNQAKENSRVSKPVMHLTVNFRPEDNISKSAQEEFVNRVIEEMKIDIDNHQFMVVRHNDKHPHYHIIANRVGFDGKTLTDSNSKLRIGTACDKIEKEMELDNYLADTRAFIYDKEKNSYQKNKNRKFNKGKAIVKRSRNRKVGVQHKKDYIQAQTIKALQNVNVNSLDKLKAELLKNKIEFIYTVNKNNQVGVSFRYDNLSVKGSQLSLKGNLINNQLTENAIVANQVNEKLNLMNNIKQSNNRLAQSIHDLVGIYNSGKTANLQEVFSKNGLILSPDFEVQYQNWTVNLNYLQTFETYCQTKLEQANEKHKSQTESYNRLKNTELKKGFLGILTPEQKKYNLHLLVQKENTPEPKLDVGIKLTDFNKAVLDKLEETYQTIESIKIMREKAFEVDQSINLDIKSIVKEQSIINEFSKSIATPEDEETQPKKKTRRRR